MAKSVLVLRSSLLHESDNLTRFDQFIYRELINFTDNGRRGIIGTVYDNCCRSVMELQTAFAKDGVSHPQTP